MGQEDLNTHLLMSGGVWTTRRLVLFTSSTPTNRGMQAEQVQNLLKNPQSLEALKIGRDVGSEIAQASMRVEEQRELARQMELGRNAEQLQQPEINPLQQQLPFN